MSLNINKQPEASISSFRTQTSPPETKSTERQNPKGINTKSTVPDQDKKIKNLSNQEFLLGQAASSNGNTNDGRKLIDQARAAFKASNSTASSSTASSSTAESSTTASSKVLNRVQNLTALGQRQISKLGGRTGQEFDIGEARAEQLAPLIQVTAQAAEKRLTTFDEKSLSQVENDLSNLQKLCGDKGEGLNIQTKVIKSLQLKIEMSIALKTISKNPNPSEEDRSLQAAAKRTETVLNNRLAQLSEIKHQEVSSKYSQRTSFESAPVDCSLLDNGSINRLAMVNLYNEMHDLGKSYLDGLNDVLSPNFGSKPKKSFLQEAASCGVITEKRCAELEAQLHELHDAYSKLSSKNSQEPLKRADEHNVLECFKELLQSHTPDKISRWMEASAALIHTGGEFRGILTGLQDIKTKASRALYTNLSDMNGGQPITPFARVYQWPMRVKDLYMGTEKEALKTAANDPLTEALTQRKVCAQDWLEYVNMA